MIATGGLRHGLDVIRALAIGANLGGMAWQLLKPASIGYEELRREIEMIIHEIKVGMFLSGASGTSDMKNIRTIFTGRTAPPVILFGASCGFEVKKENVP